ncbi:zinc ribbon domain-containing protein [Ramlibacter tataouinensis]|uniref:FmdB family zinc ribbon protein n=1 Tax=Ramlibacter tataouinensis TaxID=94132 RepID=UPI0022F3F479|nr:FmdB family zinc ribbon protein [Ramlibacter tataouinensis]WBY03409.1 zinc ribbon domain-containing protein [Ramlibacter tataouinensis]
MPIYAYKCGSCGHAKDVLQKLSDAPLTTCPACGADAFSKQLTAAGFQLKGSGWYVTDFRNGSGGAAKAPAAEGASGGGDAKPAEKASSDTKSSDAAPAKSDSPAASAGGCGSACGCH